MNGEAVSQYRLIKKLGPLFHKHGVPHCKVQNVRARRAIAGEQVVTITSNGVEGTNVAEDGEFIIENQTEARERYIVTAETFHGKYRLLEELEDGWGMFAPDQESLVLALKVDDALIQLLGQRSRFQIDASWGYTQEVSQGDFLVAPSDLREVYCIAAKEFVETYVVAGENA
jgi:hypothetical protein